MRSTDFRADVSPASAKRRLEFWLALDIAIYAGRLPAELTGADEQRPVTDITLDNALQGLIDANLRLARLQIERLASQSASHPDQGR